ncbi:MAG: PhnD/SsuA/transferrin family substrate-binding protein [Burkholderiales bacterium]|nr:PhnD/SsuA/transferrin family substrate-binding protein [Burkholderiales bacterium]
MSFIANARMYAVSPDAEAAWRALLGHVAREAEVDLDYVPYPAPQPLEALWTRPDLGCVFMCGYPIALGIAPVTPIAAPIPAQAWAGGRAVYRSDLIVRADAPFRTLEDTFGHRAGWTVEHSHSGFNAFRHHLLRYVTPARPQLYAEMIGHLVTARAILDAVVDGRIDVGPLDAYWHALMTRHRPELAAHVRVVESTDPAPIPAFVAAPAVPADAVDRLRVAFGAAAGRPWFAQLRDMLLIDGFAPVTRDAFATTLAWDREAKVAGYTLPR